MKKLGFIIVSVCFSLNMSAQDEYTGALLWKIVGKDIKKPSYILGTHHTIPVSYTDSIPGLRQTLKQVKQVVGEIDLLDPMKISTIMTQYIQMPAGYSYKTLLSEDEYKLIDKQLSIHFGMGLDKLGNLHPMAIYTMLIQMTCSKSFPDMQNPDFEPLDMYIQNIARSEKKKVMGLETIEEQFEILYNSEPIEAQVKNNLMCLVKNLDEMIDGFIEITEMYYQKQLYKLYELYYKDISEKTNPDDYCTFSQSYLNALNNNRNDKWLTVLPQIMKKKPSLIAVGAGHLGGESGLLYQLAKMGYVVKPVVE